MLEAFLREWDFSMHGQEISSSQASSGRMKLHFTAGIKVDQSHVRIRRATLATIATMSA